MLENPQSASGHQSQFLKINSDIVYCFVFSTNFVKINQYSIQGFKPSIKLTSPQIEHSVVSTKAVIFLNLGALHMPYIYNANY